MPQVVEHWLSKCKALNSNPSTTNKRIGHTWWCIPIIPTLRRLIQEDQEFETSLEYIRDHISKKKKNSLCSKEYAMKPPFLTIS
jgi:hypothetical protein